MTHFLASKENPDGFRLEDVFIALRKDLVKRSTLILDDDRPQARQVLDNDIKILSLLSECIHTAEESSRLLDHAFGKHQEGKPRIGHL